ncbi:MAG: metal ABC transporter ATP-binding protein [Candidatus Cloacimonetes bacterium]|nr:metal ABC transporter ATP-binding protein [Candidatus Cloacimonadota bacterium]
MNTPVIECNGLGFSYQKQPILKNIDLLVEERDFMAVLGPNGGGKSTLLKLILGLLQPVGGRLTIFGTSPLKARHRIGYVPQYARFDQDFPILVREVVAMSALQKNSFLPWYGSGVMKKARKLMTDLGIEKLANIRLGELSGGQKQRVLIARALMTDPDLLLLDEPTASVDSSAEKDIYELLRDYNREKTVILVSHDIAFVSSYVNKVTCLNVCSCTHHIDEIEGTVMDAYNIALRSLHHTCNL